jgi:Tfp pilus assembly protein PilZ
MDIRSGSDHRQFNRAPFNRAVKFTMDTQAVMARQLARDISQGGIRVNSNEFVALGSIVKVFVQLQDQGRQWGLNGKVVWVRYVPRFQVYELGLQFLEEAPIGRRDIALYVDRNQEVTA